VRAVYGSRCAVIRPTYIVGPGDPTDRFTYWPVRAYQGVRCSPRERAAIRCSSSKCVILPSSPRPARSTATQATSISATHRAASAWASCLSRAGNFQGRQESHLGRCEIHRGAEVHRKRDPDLVADRRRVRRSVPGGICSCRGEGIEVPAAGLDRKRHPCVACHASPRAARKTQSGPHPGTGTRAFAKVAAFEEGGLSTGIRK
jgi:hypothetical protein